MLILFASMLATLASILSARAALELEILALRHQIVRASEVRRKTPKVDFWGPSVLDLSLPALARLVLSAGHRQAGNRRGLASRHLSPVLDLEGAVRPTRSAHHFA